MHCLLVAATATEIAPAKQYFEQQAGTRNVPDMLVTGVGMLATAWQLSRYISIKRPELIIHAGIAGCFNRDTPLCKVFTVETELIADLGVHEHGVWKDVFDMGLGKASAFPFSRKELRNPHKELLKKIKLPRVRAITVNTISSGKKQVAERQLHYRPLLESMEGAALHYVALLENIPFVQLRSVSNYAGERNKKHWRIAESVEALNKEIIRVAGIIK